MMRRSNLPQLNHFAGLPALGKFTGGAGHHEAKRCGGFPKRRVNDNLSTAETALCSRTDIVQHARASCRSHRPFRSVEGRPGDGVFTDDPTSGRTLRDACRDYIEAMVVDSDEGDQDDGDDDET
jgi:hypothetical protein